MALRPHRNPLDVMVDWQLRIETEPIERRHRILALIIAVAVLTAAAAASFIYPHKPIGVWRWLAYMALSAPYFLCAGIGIFGLSGVARKMVWRRGYTAGRRSYIVNMAEALERGMHPIEWLASEFERDGHPVHIAYDDYGAPAELHAALPTSWAPWRPGEDPR